MISAPASMLILNSFGVSEVDTSNNLLISFHIVSVGHTFAITKIFRITDFKRKCGMT